MDPEVILPSKCVWFRDTNWARKHRLIVVGNICPSWIWIGQCEKSDIDERCQMSTCNTLNTAPKNSP